jgi:hypothetical protein
LSIQAGEDGRALVKCHAGCTVDAVCGAIGLRASDLFEPGASRRNGHAPNTRVRGDGDETKRRPARVKDSVTVAGDATGRRTFPTARDAVAALKRRRGQPSATWTYHNAAGEPVGVVVRWDLPADPTDPESKPSKDIQPVSKLATDWAVKGMPTPRPLYRLPQLRATRLGDRVYVTEGEKAADAAVELGLMATTSPHGSKSAAKADWSPLAGRDVVVLPDHDDAGERFAADVVRFATAAGAKSVRVVRLVELWAGMPQGGDMADLVENLGGDKDAIHSDVEALVSKTELIDASSIDCAHAQLPPSRRPFPIDALPPTLSEFARVSADRLGCDPIYIIQPAFVALAGAVGYSVSVVVRHGWLEPCAIWTGVVAPPSTMKTPARRRAMAPVYAAQRLADAEHREATNRHRGDVITFDAQMDLIKKAARKGEPVAEQLPEEPEPPAHRQLIVRDATREALVQILTTNPRGVVSDQDELAGMLGAFGAYSGGGRNRAEPDAAFYKSAWSGETFVENRKGNGGTYTNIHPLLSIYGAIQPGALGPVLGHQRIADGSASRFLWAQPLDEPARFPDERDDENDDHADQYANVHRVLCSIPGRISEDGVMSPQCIGLTKDAKEIGRAWVNELGARIVDEADPALRAALGKLKGYVFRLALLFELIEWAARGGAQPLRAIEPDTMRRATVVADWYAHEAARVYCALDESEEDSQIRRLIEWIDGRGGSVTARELSRGPREYRGAGKAEAAIAGLVEAGVGYWVDEPTGPEGGRPVRRFHLSPSGSDGDKSSAGVVASRVLSPSPASPSVHHDDDGWGNV